ncbi:MAG: LCP family protein [Oscillospiraceae bacterium]|nr:LCP family protein [Oscillospiraceae bacterium]
MKVFSGGGSHTGREKPQKKEKTGMSGGKKALIIILSIILALVLAVILFLTLYVKPPESPQPILSVTTIDPDTGEKIVREVDENLEYKDSFYNILLAGTDYEGIRTDTIMIARINTKDHTVALMSIPRDSLVQIGSRRDRINTVYATYGMGQAGMEALMLEVEDVLGFMPSGYALINLNAFVEMVDTVGGVYFDVPQRMLYSDPTQDLYIDLYPGYQLLDGEHAMQLVRYRSYAAADIQRTHVQQDFMKELAKQCLSGGNLTKISEYCEILQRNVTTNFTTGNLLYFAQELMKCDLDAAESYTLPGDPVMVNGASCYRLREAEVKEIVDKSFNPYVER